MSGAAISALLMRLPTNEQGERRREKEGAYFRNSDSSQQSNQEAKQNMERRDSLPHSEKKYRKQVRKTNTKERGERWDKSEQIYNKKHILFFKQEKRIEGHFFIMDFRLH